jgi:hypothetical protein
MTLPIDSTSGLDPLNNETAVIVARNDVNAERTVFIRNDDLFIAHTGNDRFRVNGFPETRASRFFRFVAGCSERFSPPHDVEGTLGVEVERVHGLTVVVAFREVVNLKDDKILILQFYRYYEIHL